MKQISILLHVLSIQIYGTNIDTHYNTYLGTNQHFFYKTMAEKYNTIFFA